MYDTKFNELSAKIRVVKIKQLDANEPEAQAVIKEVLGLDEDDVGLGEKDNLKYKLGIIPDMDDKYYYKYVCVKFSSDLAASLSDLIYWKR